MPRFYDVTIPITDGMTVYPGDLPVVFKRTRTIEKDGYNWSQLACGTHLGTHLDAPLHFVADGASLDDFPPELMTGMVEVVGVDAAMVDRAVLEKVAIADWSAVFFKTRNSELWKRKQFSETYVSLTPDAAEFLVRKGTRLVGIDYRSVECFETHDYPVHKALLSSGAFILEGLVLNDVPAGRYRLHCLPLRLAAADGGPARVILEVLSH